MKLSVPAVGEVAKVHLRGESPYAECVAVHGDSWDGRIANKLFREYSGAEKAAWVDDNFGGGRPLPELHKYKKGDVLRFVRSVYPDFEIWEPRDALS